MTVQWIITGGLKQKHKKQNIRKREQKEVRMRYMCWNATICIYDR